MSERLPAWAVGADAALRASGSSAAGLDEAEAARRLAANGPNRLPRPAPRSAWRLALAQLGGRLNLILLGASVLAGLVGDAKDALMIAGVVAFNSALGFFQERRAERTVAALERLVALKANVLRAGRPSEVPAETLVVGDVVLLAGGDRVPADGRLLETVGLEIDESGLTGESLPVPKRAAAVAPAGGPLAERPNFAFMSTPVTRGRGVLLVTATGRDTQMGRVTALVEGAASPKSPLQRQMDQLGQRLLWVAGVVVGLITGFELWRGAPLTELAFSAIALFVAVVPEGLPAVVTVTLALGLHRMARHRAIVKRLAAVETLGCTTVICTDKTGTLTMNQMTARALWFRGQSFAIDEDGVRAEAHGPAAGQSELEPVALALALCNDSRLEGGALIGDPTEGALLALARKAGLDTERARARSPRIAEVPFESERRFMATLHAEGAGVRTALKGATDVVLERCATVLGAQGVEPLDERRRLGVLARQEAMAARGLRVLAVAMGTAEAAMVEGEPLPQTEGLTLLGLVGLVDPPRPEAKRAIEQCRAAGIAVKMITGDHRTTAAAIAQELGLTGGVMDGAELDRLDDRALQDRVTAVAVFARVAPEHKLRIVRALRAQGHVVAMTGDGVNDAPAIKSADIGVAMGSGTEVAKEASTMVLTDDNFATIVGAVRQGRTIYDNILKFVRFQLSTNVGAILTVFLAPLLGLPVPLKPIHILYVALFTDGPPAIALGLDPERPAIMSEAPRDPRAQILSARLLGVLLFTGAIMAAGTLGLLRLGGLNADHAATLAFTTFVFFQLFNLLNVRSAGRSVFNRQLFSNRGLWLAVALVAGAQVAIVNWPPLRPLFDTVPLSSREWGLALAFGATLVVLDELRKLVGTGGRGLRAAAKRPRHGPRVPA